MHGYTYDVLGRSLTDAVTTLGSGVNGAVRRLQTSYNTQGLPEKFTSYNAATSGSVVNEAQRAYNGLGQVITEYQAHSGAVNTGSSPKVQYAYSEMASGVNHSRLKSMTYPNGRVLRYEYSSGLDSDISRISYLADDSSGSVGTHLEEYSYLGSGTIVRKNRPEPGGQLTYIKQGAEPVADAGDQYTGLDRFGRVVDQRWLDHYGSHSDRWTYAYDKSSNPLYKKNELQSTMSELYHANSANGGDNNTAYDKLNRLTGFRRGTLSSSGNNGSGLDTVTTASRTQGWSLDALGNSTSVSTNGTPQSRTHNSKNQSTVVGGNNLVFDDAGNTKTDESGKQHVYDAWNRLVESKASAGAGGASLVTHAYDALGRRIVETSGGIPTDIYYSSNWQVLEEGYYGSSGKLSQYVWSIGYIDDLVLRDRDADANSGTGDFGKSGSGLEERIYAQQDANHNVTSLVDQTDQLLQRFVYDPYGAATVLDTSWSGTTDAYGFLYRRQGTRLEVNTSLYDSRGRFYSPNLMRCMQEDPAGYVDGDSLYGYERHAPVRFADPLGLWSKETDAIMKGYQAKAQESGISDSMFREASVAMPGHLEIVPGEVAGPSYTENSIFKGDVRVTLERRTYNNVLTGNATAAQLGTMLNELWHAIYKSLVLNKDRCSWIKDLINNEAKRFQGNTEMVDEAISEIIGTIPSLLAMDPKLRTLDNMSWGEPQHNLSKTDKWLGNVLAKQQVSRHMRGLAIYVLYKGTTAPRCKKGESVEEFLSGLNDLWEEYAIDVPKADSNKELNRKVSDYINFGKR